MADEARKVLSHLLSTVQDPKSRHHDKYAEWLQNSPGIEDFIFGCLGPQVIRWIESGKGSSIDSMKAIGGDIGSTRRGVYLHGILGLDRYTRKYIGQTNDISIRMKKQHMYFRWRRDHASLHYFAVQRSSYDIFSILAEIPKPPSAVQIVIKHRTHYWWRPSNSQFSLLGSHRPCPQYPRDVDLPPLPFSPKSLPSGIPTARLPRSHWTTGEPERRSSSRPRRRNVRT